MTLPSAGGDLIDMKSLNSPLLLCVNSSDAFRKLFGSLQ